MALLISPPLGSVMTYDPAFKVDVSQNEPLYRLGVTVNDVMLDVMSVCAQLDLLVRKELTMTENARIDNGNVSRSFETKAMVMLKRIQTHLDKLPAPRPSPEDYMDLSGLAQLYPRAAAYITRPKALSIAHKTTTMDGYFAHLANLHQLIIMAHQINSDVTNLHNHKYIAHQVVLLHQALGGFPDNPALVKLKKNIEENFKTIKDSLTPEESHQEVRLPSEHAQWLLDISSRIVQEATSLPADVAGKLFLPARTLLTAS